MRVFNKGNLDLGIFEGKGSMAAFTTDGESLQVCCIRVTADVLHQSDLSLELTDPLC